MLKFRKSVGVLNFLLLLCFFFTFFSSSNIFIKKILARENGIIYMHLFTRVCMCVCCVYLRQSTGNKKKKEQVALVQNNIIVKVVIHIYFLKICQRKFGIIISKHFVYYLYNRFYNPR